jgi:hypothetical protein
MTQVNSSPGQNQNAGNVAVSYGINETGVTSAKATAAAVVVPYTQSEPGKTVNPKRS